MASVCNDPNELKRVLYTVGGHRHVLRLGRVELDVAQATADKIERLIACQNNPELLSTDVLRWATGLTDKRYANLARAGLLPPRESTVRKIVTIETFLTKVFSLLHVKPATLTNYGQTRDNLLGFFGKGESLHSLTPERVDEFRAWLFTELSPATAARRIVSCRQFFKAAVKWGHLPLNPFEGVKGGTQKNSKREEFVDRETVHRVIDACPDNQWRLIVVLARYEGVRVPSEIHPLRWGDVDWEGCRLTVHSPKTEHHDGKECRVTPIFPEAMPYLRAVYDEAPEGTEYIITRYRENNANLRTQFERIIKRAGVKKWHKLFQNLRASRETELWEEYPLKTACEWIGNSPKVALEHYMMNYQKDAHFDRAIGRGAKAAQKEARGQDKIRENGDKLAAVEVQEAAVKRQESGFSGGEELGVPRLAQPRKTRKPEGKIESGAQSGAPSWYDEAIALGWKPPAKESPDAH